MKKITSFLREVVSEVRKVTWPGRKELVGSTIVVIVLVLLVSFYIGLVDFVLSRLMEMVL